MRKECGVFDVYKNNKILSKPFNSLSVQWRQRGLWYSQRSTLRWLYCSSSKECPVAAKASVLQFIFGFRQHTHGFSMLCCFSADPRECSLLLFRLRLAKSMSVMRQQSGVSHSQTYKCHVITFAWKQALFFSCFHFQNMAVTILQFSFGSQTFQKDTIKIAVRQNPGVLQKTLLFLE